MCLAVIALDAHRRYRLVAAANRDEFHARPTQAAHWWRDVPILAGRDLAQGGTWLGVSRDARLAFVTNVREPARYDPNARSRGALVPALLEHHGEIARAVNDVVDAATDCNGFNLVGATAYEAAFGSNRGPRSQPLSRGVFGVSNAGLDTAWPKLVRAKNGVANWLATGDDAIDDLWSVLRDETRADEAALPSTGVTRERERLLSSPFIVSDGYGTRSSTIVTIDRDGEVTFVERTFDAAGNLTGESAFRFASERSPDQSARRIAQCAMPASSNLSPSATKP
jgi:uncharacterized protein with NRDE domain